MMMMNSVIVLLSAPVPALSAYNTELYAVRCGLAVAAVLRPAIWPSTVREEAVIWLAIGPLGGFC